MIYNLGISFDNIVLKTKNYPTPPKISLFTLNLLMEF